MQAIAEKRSTDNTPGCEGDAISLYVIYSQHGLLMDRFDNLGIAMECFQRWPTAASVVCSGRVIVER